MLLFGKKPFSEERNTKLSLYEQIRTGDGSGAGDVDTSKVVESKLVEGQRTIEGLTGRTLVIPEDWKNPTDKWHVGVKNAYDLYPRGLKDRVVHDRQEKLWDPEHKKCQADAVKKQQVKHEGDNDKEDNVSLMEKLVKDNNHQSLS